MTEAVRSLGRGLEILYRLSSVDGMSANEMVKATRLPRATVYRLLNTLDQLGYAQLTASDNRYRLTDYALTLGKTGDWEAWVNDHALPSMREFTAANLWSLDLSTLHGDQLIMRGTSDSISPYTLKHYRRGHPISLLRTSPGQVFLAFCEPALRESLLDILKMQDLPPDSMSVLARLDYILERIRCDRHAATPFRFGGEAALAVPLFVNDHLYGCLSLRYIARTFNLSAARSTFLEPLWTVADDISSRIAADASSQVAKNYPNGSHVSGHILQRENRP